jgi:putative FmdB family regulatory protein
MPIYVYQCEQHGEFDMILPVSECDKEQKCPECGVDCSNIISSTSFQLKGKWFKTNGEY